ncbi:MAG: hypothetical protein MJZ39_04205 [Bacteroidales bacterium]|nr:hypothetical protein [Bacteroidales bacterium]
MATLEERICKDMKSIPLILMITTFSLSSFCQCFSPNINVIVLGEKKMENPIVISINENARKIDSCHINCNCYNYPLMMLLEKKNFDLIKDYTELSVFDQSCYFYNPSFFGSLVHDYIIPYMDTDSELYQRLRNAYPRAWIYPYDKPVLSVVDHGTYRYAEILPHNFMIVLMNARTYNEYLSTISPVSSYYEGTFEENGIYFKVAIPLPEEED